MENQMTTVTSFILLGFSYNLSVNIFLFLVFFFIYVTTLVGNMMIMVVTTYLPSPIYFFLALFFLTFLDICFSSATVPKLLVMFYAGQTISYSACFSQMFFVFLMGTTEHYILAAMAYDRYAAICKPLNYVQIMNKAFCRVLVGGAWATSFLCSTINVLPILRLSFCGPNIIRHFNCEFPNLLALSCSETFLNKLAFFMTGSAFAGSSLIIILLSYIHIISTILKLNSAEAKRKTFSTCSAHLIVVALYYSTGCFRYMRPNSASSVIVDELFSIQYGISTPMINPLIYSLSWCYMNTSYSLFWKEAEAKIKVLTTH